MAVTGSDRDDIRYTLRMTANETVVHQPGWTLRASLSAAFIASAAIWSITDFVVAAQNGSLNTWGAGPYTLLALIGALLPVEPTETVAPWWRKALVVTGTVVGAAPLAWYTVTLIVRLSAIPA